MSIQHKKGASMMERDGTMQPNVVVSFSSELGSILDFRNEWYREIGEYNQGSFANVDTVKAIHAYCDVIEPRMVLHL